MSVKIHTRKLDEPHVVIAESEWRSLIEVARHISPVDVEETLPNADCGTRNADCGLISPCRLAGEKN